jgi:chromosome segregation ATPase
MSHERFNRIDARLEQLEVTQRAYASFLNDLATASEALRRYDANLERARQDDLLRQLRHEELDQKVKVIADGLGVATRRLYDAEMRVVRVRGEMDILEARVDRVEQRSDAMMADLDRTQRWFARVERWNLDHGVRLDQIELRLGELESRIEQIDVRIERFDKSLQAIAKDRTH